MSSEPGWIRAVLRWEREFGSEHPWSELRLLDPIARVRLLRGMEPEVARRISAWLDLGERAAAKWPHLRDPLCSRAALEQGTAFAVAHWRARFLRERCETPGPWWDLGCGAGGEVTAWQTVLDDTPLYARDIDAERVAMAAANVLRGNEPRSDRVEVQLADVPTQYDLAEAAIVFADPSRRNQQGQRSSTSLHHAAPDADTLARTAHAAGGRLAVKAAPACRELGPLAELRPELVHVSLDGEMKEVSLYCGPLRRTALRAVALPSAEEVCDVEQPSSAEQSRVRGRSIAVPSPQSWREGVVLATADVAVRRARLGRVLAERLGAPAYGEEHELILLGETDPLPPSGRGHLLRLHRLERVLPSERRALLRELRALRGESLVVRQAGPFRPGATVRDALAALKVQRGTTGAPRVVLAVTVEGRPRLALCSSIDGVPRPPSSPISRP